MSLKSAKRLTAFALAFLLLFTLTACNSSKIGNENTTEIAQVTAEATTESTSIEASSETTESYEPFYVEDHELTALDGTKTSLHAYEGQLIVLNFWATWCTYCVQEMPFLDEIDKRDDITVLAVSVGEDVETVKKYIEDAGYDFDVFLDAEGTLASTFGVTGFPTSIFIGPDFEYYYTYPGMLEQKTFDSVLEAIDEIVAERKDK